MISIFKERKLKIKISTNLDMKTQSQENFIDFNISILKIPKSNINSLLKLEDYPYFTGEVKYPWNYLYNIPYQRKLEFFFNHNNFIQILLQYNANFANYQTKNYNQIIKEGSDFKGGKAPQEEEEEQEDFIYDHEKKQLKKKKKNKDLRNSIVKENIMMMLKCLFPTKYPYKVNIKTSHDLKILKSPQINLDLPEEFLNLFRLYSDEENNSKIFTDYSYLKLEQKIYTVTEVIWINDIFNHPKYNKLMIEYFDLIFFKTNYTRIIADINKVKIDSFKERNITSIDAINKPLFNLLNNIVIDNIYNTDKPLPITNLQEFKKSKKQNDQKGDISLIVKLLENISSFDEKFKILKNKDKEIKESSQFDDIYGNITNIIDNFDNYKVRLIKGYYYNPLFTIPQVFNDFLDQIKFLQITIKEIRDNLYIYNTYLNNTRLEKKILFDKKIDEENKKKLKNYINFFKEVDKFSTSVYATNNGYLQEAIEKFINNIDNDLLTIINPSNLKNANIPYNRFHDESKNYKKYIYSGVNLDIVNDFYEIFIRLDLIEGEVNDENTQNIKCVYSGEKMTDKLDTLLSSNSKFWELNPRRMLFVLDEMKGYSRIGTNYTYKISDEIDNDKNIEDDKKYKNNFKENQEKRYDKENNDEIIPPPFFNPFRAQGGKSTKNITRKLKSNLIN